MITFTKNIKTMKKILTLAAIAVIGLTAFSGCKKSSSSSSSNSFVGKYIGTSSCSGTVDTINITAGSSSSVINFPTNVGTGTCYKAVTYIANVSGNNYTVPSQTFTDNCSNSYTISGNGSLSGNSLMFNLTLTSTVVSGTINCTFTGAKQ